LSDPVLDAWNSGVYQDGARLIQNLLSELAKVVRKSESGIKVSRNSSVPDELDRAYFRDMLELVFKGTVGHFGRLLTGISSIPLRTQLRDQITHNLRRLAPTALIDSDLCQTIFMTDFSALLTRFITDLERSAHCPKFAA
jgi:hypothetical protein